MVKGSPTLEADGPMAIEKDPKPRWRFNRDFRETGRLDAMAIKLCEVFHDITASREECAMLTIIAQGMVDASSNDKPIRLDIQQTPIVSLHFGLYYAEIKRLLKSVVRKFGPGRQVCFWVALPGWRTWGLR